MPNYTIPYISYYFKIKNYNPISSEITQKLHYAYQSDEGHYVYVLIG